MNVYKVYPNWLRLDK